MSDPLEPGETRDFISFVVVVLAAACFGVWQRSPSAGAFMFAILTVYRQVHAP